MRLLLDIHLAMLSEDKDRAAEDGSEFLVGIRQAVVRFEIGVAIQTKMLVF